MSTDTDKANAVTFDALRQQSDHNLRLTRDHLQQRQDELREQLIEARRHHAETGEYAERRWYAETEGAVMALGRAIQRVQSEQSRRKGMARRRTEIEQQRQSARLAREAEEKRRLASTFEVRFVEAAKTILPATTFRDIARAAATVGAGGGA